MTFGSQTALAPVANWFPAKPPTGYTALLCEDSENGHYDVEVRALRPAADIETASPATNRWTTPSRAKILDVLKTFVTLVAFGLLSALLFSAWMWFAGGYILYSLKLPPYTSMDPMDMLRASMAGAPVIALIVSSVTLILCGPTRPDSETRRDCGEMARLGAAACAPLSVFAMPLGFVMMPHLMVGGFGLRHALAMSATGLGTLVVAFLLELAQLSRSR